MNFKLFGKTILVVNIKFILFLGHPLSQGEYGVYEDSDCPWRCQLACCERCPRTPKKGHVGVIGVFSFFPPGALGEWNGPFLATRRIRIRRVENESNRRVSVCMCQNRDLNPQNDWFPFGFHSIQPQKGCPFQKAQYTHPSSTEVAEAFRKTTGTPLSCHGI